MNIFCLDRPYRDRNGRKLEKLNRIFWYSLIDFLFKTNTGLYKCRTSMHMIRIIFGGNVNNTICLFINKLQSCVSLVDFYQNILDNFPIIGLSFMLNVSFNVFLLLQQPGAEETQWITVSIYIPFWIE